MREFDEMADLLDSVGKTTKLCRGCLQIKKLECFGTFERRDRVNYYGRCKPCLRQYMVQYYHKYKVRPEHKAYKAKYYRENKDRIAAERKSYRAQYRVMNADTLSEKQRDYTTKNWRVVTEKALFSTYNMDFEDWARMFESQNGKCSGCCEQLTLDRRTHVDHDHHSGMVRGLLCGACNLALGSARDSPYILRRLAQYVEDSDNRYGDRDPYDEYVEARFEAGLSKRGTV